jgi:type I protein arginine methyltransferase
MYTLQDYGKMLADRVRMEAYLEALRRAVFPGCVVIDLGAGPGIFSLYACRWGARRVYAIEPGESIQLARELAAANGFVDTIVAIEDYSSNLTLPERADVIISDLRGVLPFFGRSIASIIDARDRLLANDGILIPLRDILWAGIVSVPEFYRRKVEIWDQPGFDTSAARTQAVNTIFKIYPKIGDLLTAPAELGDIDYPSVTTTRFAAHPSWRIGRSGVAHGVCMWFATTLADGVSFSNAPGLPETIYGAAFMPFSEPMPLESGDRVSCEIKIDPCGEDYVWRWNTSFEIGSSGVLRGGFSQSTFYATPVNPASLNAVDVATG